MAEDEIKTFPLSLAEEVSGITVSIPWAQRQANGAVIVRVHAQSQRHTAGELLLNESDVIALDPDERPLRTQVRRFWGYSALDEVTPAHLQTARFDVGFRLDLNSTGGQCGVAIAIMRSFRPGEGPKAVGGPWVFKFRVTDDQEAATLARAEAARQEAARLESARQEAARQEAMRLDAERREAARQERARAEAARAERIAAERQATERPAAERQAAATEPVGEGTPAAARFQRPDAMRQEQGSGRRATVRFLRPEEAGRAEDEPAPGPTPAQRLRPAEPAAAPPATAAVTEAAVMGEEPPTTAAAPPRRGPRTVTRSRAATADADADAQETTPAPRPRAPRRAAPKAAGESAPSEGGAEPD